MVHFVSYFDVTQTFIVERHLHNDTTRSRNSSSLYKGCGSLETRITRHRMAGWLLMSDTSINVFMAIKSFSPNQNEHTLSFLFALTITAFNHAHNQNGINHSFQMWFLFMPAWSHTQIVFCSFRDQTPFINPLSNLFRIQNRPKKINK